jgi:hypothetical protein
MAYPESDQEGTLGLDVAQTLLARADTLIDRFADRAGRTCAARESDSVANLIFAVA